ncbi:MAG TPA: hypothetical protein VGN20_08790 [Mucilaginibacter sp.]|jgi:hypothetical protein
MRRAIIVFIIFLPYCCFAQFKQNHGFKNDSTVAENVIAKLKTFSEQHITEKTYLHFDKSYYVAGDTIYFKAYVTLGEKHQLSDLSGLLHVDLINANNKVDQSEILQLKDGVTWGDFALPDSLPKGNYRVRAYTQWMRNDGDGAYFNRVIPIGSLSDDKIPESGDRNTSNAKGKPDIQFLPEGGQLVMGINSKVAFKAIAGNGLGIDVTGVVVDDENKQIATFSSTHLGMGYFHLTPESGKSYRAKLTYADGSQNFIDMPKATDNGVVLSINNDSIPKATVRIEASKAWYQENKNKDYTLLIYSGGIATMVTCALDSQVVTMDILKRHLHTGVATVTLFSSTGEPLCERLLFIQNYNQLSMAINSDKTKYSKRGKVNIDLNVKSRSGYPAEGHFSVAVVNESVVQVDENSSKTILTNLLLTSDLKGYVEQPNYYFNEITDKTLTDLDLVMLTHGYRKFDWKQILNNTNPPPSFQPENGLEINGTAKILFGGPVVKGTVSLISKQSATFLSTTTDDKGFFRFSNLEFADTTKFILQAVNTKGKDNTKLRYEKYQTIGVSPIENVDGTAVGKFQYAYIENAKAEQLHSIKGKLLKEVFINDKKVKHYPSNGNFIEPESADQLVTSDDLERLRGLKLSEITAQKFCCGPAMGHGLIVVDGMSMPPGFSIDDLNPNDIETIGAVYYANASIYGVRGGRGVWLITTKRGKGSDSKDIASVGILPITAKGFYKAREFYSPKYDSPNLANNHPDFRSTIFWKPELVTDKDGNTSFEYYNADGTGTYKIVVEGIDNEGNLGRQVYRYKVE